MGKKLTTRTITAHPMCVYCGGGAAAQQVDHVPPIAMFTLRRRPQGLEFSTCEQCHKGTRNMDAVAALTARSWPNLATDDEREELQRLMGGVLRNVPPVRDELARGYATQEAVPSDIAAAVGEDVHVMDFTVRRAILEAFGARIALALHYDLTGSPLSEAGGVWAHVYTNVENLRGLALPEQLDGLLGPTIALMQKGLAAEKDFHCARHRLEEHAGTVSFSAFRQSFAVLAICYPAVDDFPPDLRDDLFQPGFLQGYPV
jgi:hypothetical protein